MYQGVHNSWTAASQHPMKMEPYADQLLHRVDGHPASWPIEVPRSSLPPHLISGGSMCSAGSAVDLQAMYAHGTDGGPPRRRVEIVPHMQPLPDTRTTSMSYFLTNAQTVLQQQMSQLMGATQHNSAPPPPRPSARRSLRSAMDAAAQSYESPAAAGARVVGPLLGSQAGPLVQHVSPIPPHCRRRTLVELLRDGCFHTDIARSVLVHLAVQLGALHCRGLVHGCVTLQAVQGCTNAVWRLMSPPADPPLEDAADYVAPELRGTVHHHTGRQPQPTSRADMYALGVVLFKLLTGGRALAERRCNGAGIVMYLSMRFHNALSGMVTRRKAKRAEVFGGPSVFNGCGPPSVCDVQRCLDSCMQSTLEGLAPEARDLLQGLLRADPAQRLCAADVLTHAWVAPLIKHESVQDLPSPKHVPRGGSPSSCASTASGGSVHAPSAEGLRNWWAPPVSWPPQQRAARAKTGAVLPACMQPGAQLQFDIRAYTNALPVCSVAHKA